MSILAMAFREQVKKTKDYSQINEMNYSVSYPTGYPNFDFANGYIQEINGKKRFELGISDGSINMIIGDSGTGKTSFCTQAACNIVKKFSTSCIFYEQAEVGTNIQRIKNLSGFTTDDEFMNRFIIRDAGITVESIYDRVRAIHDIKLDHKDEYLYDTGLKDMMGNEIYKFEPTIVIVDSIKMVLSKKNAEDEYSNNLSAANNAKINSEYYTKMVPLCREANIIMLLINHITTDINTGFLPKKPEFPYLKQGEHLPSSKAVAYLSNGMFRLDIKSKLKPEDGLGVLGSLVSLDVIKSRTNKTSRARCTLVFDQDRGYDPDLSLFVMLKEEKLIEGAGAYLKIPNYDLKFSQKNFKELIRTNPDFYNAFAKYCIDFLSNTLNEEYESIKRNNEHTSSISPYQTILDQMNNDATNNSEPVNVDDDESYDNN